MHLAWIIHLKSIAHLLMFSQCLPVSLGNKPHKRATTKMILSLGGSSVRFTTSSDKKEMYDFPSVCFEIKKSLNFNPSFHKKTNTTIKTNSSFE